MAPASVGFWGAPTSNVNWCEKDYYHTFYIAEFWNTASGIAMACMAILGIVSLGKMLDKQTRYSYWLFFSVGIGSAAFHGTLLYSAQMLDEIPMILASLCLLHSLVTLDRKSIEVKQNHQDSFESLPTR
eukprot:Sdes_comp8494_c0_seq1m89